MPARVISRHEQDGEHVALVDFDGTTREVIISFVPEVQVGDYVVVHAGVALQRLDERAAAETLALFAQMGRGPTSPDAT